MMSQFTAVLQGSIEGNVQAAQVDTQEKIEAVNPRMSDGAVMILVLLCSAVAGLIGMSFGSSLKEAELARKAAAHVAPVVATVAEVERPNRYLAPAQLEERDGVPVLMLEPRHAPEDFGYMNTELDHGRMFVIVASEFTNADRFYLTFNNTDDKVIVGQWKQGEVESGEAMIEKLNGSIVNVTIKRPKTNVVARGRIVNIGGYQHLMTVK